MLNLVKVAVTGGLSCGKSTVCRFLKELGAYVVSADEVVHRLLSPTTTLGQKVISLVGSDIVINHQIDRARIAKKVFKQPELLKALEDLLHPAVREEIETLYNKVNGARSAKLFVAEIPLLFEIGAESFFDYTIAVFADDKLCRQRFKKTTGYDDEEYNRRMAPQMKTSEKMRRADFIINNDGSIEEMHQAVEKIYKQIVKNI